jgi:hypothetical protein
MFTTSNTDPNPALKDDPNARGSAGANLENY